MVLTYVLLVLTGAVTGLLGGMLGIGGSIIMLPVMVALLGAKVNGVEQIHQYMAAAMIVNFLLSIPSVLAHWKNKAIWPEVVKYLALGGLLGVIVGVQISQQFTGDTAKYIRWFLGAFFVYVAIENLHRVIRGPKPGRAEREHVGKGSWWPKFTIGAGVGVFAGMTGLGGGALAVPIQQRVLNMPIRNAIANSSALIVSIAWMGAITKNYGMATQGMGTISESFLLTLCLAPTAMIGAYFGGHLVHRMPVRWIRLAFALMILASSYNMFFPR